MRLTDQEKAHRKEDRRLKRLVAREIARIDADENQKPVKVLTITIEWKKSKMWGRNPHASAIASYHDGSTERIGPYKCSGCGYDKESTVIANIFNATLKYKLWTMGIDNIRGGNGSLDEGPAPYGIHVYDPIHPHFGGGIGTSCYYAIAKFIGGKFEHIASGSNFDVYKYTDKEPIRCVACEWAIQKMTTAHNTNPTEEKET